MEKIKNTTFDFFQHIAVFILFILISGIIYSNVLYGEFVADDFVTVAENPAIRNIHNLDAIWKSFNTRFLVGVSYALNYQIDQLNVFGFHLLNVIIHFINAYLVYAFVRLTFHTPVMDKHRGIKDAGLIAFFAGLIFLCHPVQTQGVSYITQRAVSLATMFYLLTLNIYILARLRNLWFLLLGAFFCMLSGFLSKEMTITIPLVLIFYEFSFLGFYEETLLKRFKCLFPFLLGTLILPMVFLQDQSGSLWGLKNQIHARSFSWIYFFTEMNVLSTYLRLFFVPVSQMFEYDYPLVKSFFEPRTLWSIVLLLGILFIAFSQYRKRRLLSFAIIWFFITTSVEVCVVSFVNRAVIYEHWMYLPMVGFSLFMSLALYLFFTNVGSYKNVMYMYLILLSLLTYQRNFVWQNEIIFWQENLQKAPQKPQVKLGLGGAYQRKHYYHQAYAYYQKALKRYYLKKDEVSGLGKTFYSQIYNNLGSVCFMLRKDREAFENYQKSIELKPDNGSVYNNLGVVYFQFKKYAQAITSFQKSLRYQEEYPEAYYYMGLSYSKLGDSLKAKENLQKAFILYESFNNELKSQETKSLLDSL